MAFKINFILCNWILYSFNSFLKSKHRFRSVDHMGKKLITYSYITYFTVSCYAVMFMFVLKDFFQVNGYLAVNINKELLAYKGNLGA